MKIQSLIKALLISNEQLVIPNFGSFVSKHKSAEIDEKTGEITPPTKEIVFDQTLTLDDGTLRGELIGQGLTLEEANKEIDFLVKSINDKLESKTNYEIPELGFLSKNDKGEIFFTTTAKESLLPGNIGLSSISFNQADLNKVTVTKEKPKKEKTKSEKKDKEITAIEKPKKEKTEKPKKDKQKSKKAVKALLIILPIVAILVLGWIFKDPIIEKGKEIFASNKDTTNTENIVNIDTNKVVNNNNNSNNSNIDNELGNDEEYRKLLDSKISSTADVFLGNSFKKFYIIVGSFSMKDNANKYKNELKNQGYDATVINGSEFYRVAIGGYDTADSLIEDYNKIKNKHGDNIWILINR
ncbi:MAG: SPOR domain-containing protein [Bacteroidales bacterium]|nr:SPOR domain-containing protein [Bacteroidales bacterium]